MAAAATNDEYFMLDSTVRGHHVYKQVWTPVVGQQLQVEAETGNVHDPHAVCTIHAGVIVGHMPREIANTAFHFLQHGGRITCEVTGHRKLSSIPNKGPLRVHVLGEATDNKETCESDVQQKEL